MIDEISKMLISITQFDSISLQPNSGANVRFNYFMLFNLLKYLSIINKYTFFE